MGKRNANLTGLSRYVLDALKDSATNAKPSAGGNSTITKNSATNVNVIEDHNSKERPKKRRRTEALIPERSKYDASGLVPSYRTVLQVPDHLQKCM